MVDRTYGFRIMWSDEDNVYLASCPEFPGVIAHGDTPEEAVAEARVALDLAIDLYDAEGRQLPEPRRLVEHSGQFRLRVPKTLHAQVVERAFEEGVSLNSYIATVIALAAGQAQGETRAAAELRTMLQELRSELDDEFVAGASRSVKEKGIPSASETLATISFGLVSVPVRVYPSVESKGSVPFHTLHSKCSSRLKRQYVCTKDGEIVRGAETVKGYEFAKDQYLVFTAEELKALEEKSSQTIDIVEFIPVEKVDRSYLEKVYYLAPDEGGDRAYRLLAEALKETGRAALGQYASSGHQYLVLLRPRQGVLVMEQLYYADEVRALTEVTVPAGRVKPQELQLAKQLIEQTATDEFDPQKYQDTVRARVLDMITRKIEGQDIIEPDPPQKASGKIIDLMEALKVSLAKPKGPERERKKVS
jgi:DNA end-binding protein Ku